jgi:hypothetical protein
MKAKCSKAVVIKADPCRLKSQQEGMSASERTYGIKMKENGQAMNYLQTFIALCLLMAGLAIPGAEGAVTATPEGVQVYSNGVLQGSAFKFIISNSPAVIVSGGQAIIDVAGGTSGASNFTDLNITNLTLYGVPSFATNAIKEGYGPAGSFGGYVCTNFLSFATNTAVQWLEITNNVVFLLTTNRDHSSAKHLRIQVWIKPAHFNQATNRTIVFHSSWGRLSGGITNTLLSNSVGVLDLTLVSGGTSGEAAVFAGWTPTLP